jgi:hypothetical protein
MIGTEATSQSTTYNGSRSITTRTTKSGTSGQKNEFGGSGMSSHRGPEIG